MAGGQLACQGSMTAVAAAVGERGGMAVHAQVHGQWCSRRQGFGTGNPGMAPAALDTPLQMSAVGEDQSGGGQPGVGIGFVRLGVADVAVFGGRVSIVTGQTVVHEWQNIVGQGLTALDTGMAFRAFHAHILYVQYVRENDAVGRFLGDGHRQVQAGDNP